MSDWVEGVDKRHEHVTPGYIREQRKTGWPDIHPETYCHRCGIINFRWGVDIPLDEWIAVMSPWAWYTGKEGITCVTCFMELYEQHTGRKFQWLLVPSDDGYSLSEWQERVDIEQAEHAATMGEVSK